MPARDMTRWSQTESGAWRYTPFQDGATAKADEDEGYESMTKAELEAELSSRGLPKTGNKDELIARLEEADSA